MVDLGSNTSYPVRKNRGFTSLFSTEGFRQNRKLSAFRALS